MEQILTVESDQSALQMRAVRIHQFGGVDTLKYEEIARPVPGEGQVLVSG